MARTWFAHSPKTRDLASAHSLVEAMLASPARRSLFDERHHSLKNIGRQSSQNFGLAVAARAAQTDCFMIALKFTGVAA
jgi:hypothetical protein